MKALTYLSGDEFIRKIMEGERDFSHIKFEDNYKIDKSDAYYDLRNYLNTVGISQDPVIMNNSECVGVSFKYMNLSNLVSQNTDFKGSDFQKSNLSDSVLTGSKFDKCSLPHSNFYNSELNSVSFKYSNLNFANFEFSNMSKSNLFGSTARETNFHGCDFSEASLRGLNANRSNFKDVVFYNSNLLDIINFDKAINLEFANYFKTKVSEKSKIVIEDAFSRKQMFIVE